VLPPYGSTYRLATRATLLVRQGRRWFVRCDGSGTYSLPTCLIGERKPREAAEACWQEHFEAKPPNLQVLGFISLREGDFDAIYFHNTLEGTAELSSKSLLPLDEETLFSSSTDSQISKLSLMRKTRRLKKRFFLFDNATTIGRTLAVSNCHGMHHLKAGTADPIDIVPTLQHIFSSGSCFSQGPIQLDVNPTTACNDSCTFCFNAVDRKMWPGTLSYSRFSSWLDRLITATDLMHVKISGFGEPLLYKKLPFILKACRDHYLYTSINTNGAGLKKIQTQIIDCVDSIRFSLDAATPRTFSEVHGSSDFQKRIQEIEELVDLRNSNKSELIIGVHYVVTPLNYAEALRCATCVKDIGVDYFEASFEKFNDNHLNDWDESYLGEAALLIQSLRSLINDRFNVILPSRATVSKEGMNHFRSTRNNDLPCWHTTFRHYVTPLGELGSCNSFEQFLPRKKLYGSLSAQSPDEALRMLVKFQVKKDDECSNCVVPFGALNDLAEWVKYSMDGNLPIRLVKTPDFIEGFAQDRPNLTNKLNSDLGRSK